MFYGLYNFLKDLFKEKKFLWRLAINDFKARYSGSFFGIIWAFIQPMVTIFVMWFVFEKGFKSMPVKGTPFILWFIPAYIPWIFFSDMVLSSTNCLYEYNYLVKKVKFRVSVIPLMKICSALFVHIFFIVFIFIMYLIYQMPLTTYAVQAFYYSGALIVFSLGLSWLLSALSVFFKDLFQLINVFLQIGFWVTPIFWNPDTMAPWVNKVLMVNPVYYVIYGYRDSFINHVPFWHHLGITIYFWVFTGFLFIAGAFTFKKLRPHFADEL